MAAPSYKVFVSPSGNIFMAEIAGMIADTIEATGREVERCTTGLPAADPGTINVVVAPHEYFLLMEEPTEAEIVEAASRSVTVGVEQPGTTWFEAGARYASYGPMAIDINRRGVQELRRRGLETYHLQFGYHPGWDAWGGDDQAVRERDVLFLGSLTNRRAEFLAESAHILSEWNCDLRVFEVDGPMRKAKGHFVTGREKHELLAGSRVLLNVHQGQRDYFEWVRVMEAISNGCLVVTETSGGYAPLLPAEHFIQAGLNSLAGRLDAFLRDEDLRAEVAQRAYDFVRKHLAFIDSVDQLLRIVERRVAAIQRARPAATGPAVVPSAMRRQGHRRHIAVPAGTGSRQEAVMASALQGEQAMRSIVKDLILAEIQEVRSIEALMSSVEVGVPCRSEVTETPSYGAAEPEVSVVLPLFNYARYVREAIKSVVASAGVVAELVVVDDHSSDDSVDVVRQAMRDFAWFPIRLVEQSANRGPSPPATPALSTPGPSWSSCSMPTIRSTPTACGTWQRSCGTATRPSPTASSRCTATSSTW